MPLERTQQFRVRVGETAYDVAVRLRADGSVAGVELAGQPRRIELGPAGGYVVADLETTAKFSVWLAPITAASASPQTGWVDGTCVPLEVRTRQRAALEDALRATGNATASSSHLRAPMPGRVVRVLVATGESVAPDQAVVIVEAMKMENEVRATASGLVTHIRVHEGQTVESGALMVEIEPHAAPD